MNNNTNGIAAARQAHSTRCRQRVLTAFEQAVHLGTEISISAISRRAGVDRSFLYRQRDLHAAVLVKAAEPTTARTGGPGVSRPSLIADLANARDRLTPLSRENTQLRQRRSEHLGEPVWRDMDRLHRRVTELEE